MISKLLKYKLYVFVLCVILFAPGDAIAWRFAPSGSASHLQTVLPGELAVVDPDDFSRDEIATLTKKGIILLAWLNVSEIENGRAYSVFLPAKELAIKPGRGSTGPTLARYYLRPWREAMLRRVQEIAQKGFSGLFLTGTENHRLLTDHPLGKTEMLSLLRLLSHEFRSERPGSELVLHGDPCLTLDPDLAGMLTGVAVDGLWYGIDGRSTRPWDRKRLFSPLKIRIGAEKRFLSIEQADKPNRVARVFREAFNLKIDACIASLPLRIQAPNCSGRNAKGGFAAILKGQGGK